MADIFGYERPAASGVFSQSGYGNATLTLGEAGSPSLVQNWKIQYSQRTTPVYEVGSAKVYWLKEPSTGTFSVEKIVGGTGITMNGEDACKSDGTSITLTQSKSCDAEAATYTMTGCVLTAVGMSSQAGRPYVTSNVEWTIGSLSM